MPKVLSSILTLISISIFFTTVTYAQRNSTLFIDGQKKTETLPANSENDSVIAFPFDTSYFHNKRISQPPVFAITPVNTNKVLRPARSKNWISVTYVKCLEKSLPCECQKLEKHTLVRLDSSYAMIHDGIIYDPNTFSLKKIDNNACQVFKTKYITELFHDSTIIMGILQIASDTLYYYDNNSNTRFAYINYGSEGDSEWAFEKEHIRLLNKAFNNRNYSTLEKILNNDSISCNCNPELGIINLVSTKANGWILEQRDGSLFIYKWTNIPNEKVNDLKIEKQLLKKYKW